MSPVTAVDATTPVTTPRPAENLLLGMVLTDDVKNNISSGNNKAVFEQKMANQYKTNNKLSSEVIFTVSFFIKFTDFAPANCLLFILHFVVRFCSKLEQKYSRLLSVRR